MKFRIDRDDPVGIRQAGIAFTHNIQIEAQFSTISILKVGAPVSQDVGAFLLGKSDGLSHPLADRQVPFIGTRGLGIVDIHLLSLLHNCTGLGGHCDTR